MKRVEDTVTSWYLQLCMHHRQNASIFCIKCISCVLVSKTWSDSKTTNKRYKQQQNMPTVTK